MDPPTNKMSSNVNPLLQIMKVAVIPLLLYCRMGQYRAISHNNANAIKTSRNFTCRINFLLPDICFFASLPVAYKVRQSHSQHLHGMEKPVAEMT